MGGIIIHLHLKDEGLAYIQILWGFFVVFFTVVSFSISPIQGQLLDCAHVNTLTPRDECCCTVVAPLLPLLKTHSWLSVGVGKDSCDYM